MSFGSHLKRLCEAHGVSAVSKTVAEGLKARKIDPYKIHIQDLARSFFGEDAYNASRILKAYRAGAVGLLEASEAQDASAFSNITGQLLVTIVKEKYDSPEFIGDRLMRTVPNPGGNLKEHKIPYLSDVLDKPSLLAQLETYPQTKFKESWVTMPAPEKRGGIVAISMEMMYSDLTGQAQDSAASAGRVLRYQKEERQLNVVLGLTNPYKWNDNALNTYYSTATTGNYANKILSNTIANYSQVNDVEQLFWKQVDPITGRRILARPTLILCMPAKRYDMKRIINATELNYGNSASDTGVRTTSANPLDQTYPILTSPIAEQLLLDSGLSASVVKERVYFLDPFAFGYRQVYDLKVDNAPPGNPMEFEQDVVLALKVSEFGVPFVYDPRYTAMSTSEAS